MNCNNEAKAASKNAKEEEEKPESQTLKCLLADKSPNNDGVHWFFKQVWQDKCAEFRWKNRLPMLPTGTVCDNSNGDSNVWNDDAVKTSPLEEMVHQGWNAVVQLLESGGPNDDAASAAMMGGEGHTTPLLFKDQCNVSDELESSYNNSLFAAYLDGCSVVINHADWKSPWIAALCQDLQKSFPHAYANVYITPPGSQAVRAHADDRDVFVIQVAGQKRWKVYQKIPIPSPYPPEQVGKSGLEVPQEVLKGPFLIESTLTSGDVLYMPRGYVHEAVANSKDFSFHVTIALATHDWTLAGILTTATEKILHNVLPYRKAIDRRFGMQDLKTIPQQDQQQLKQQIDDAFQLLTKQVTVEAISNNLEDKYNRHNQRAFSARMRLMHNMRFPPSVSGIEGSGIVGPDAAKTVRINTLVRAATDEEKESVMMDQPRGLRAREQIADQIIQILLCLKSMKSGEGPIAVKDLKRLLGEQSNTADLICNLTLLSFVKVCVGQGALAVVQA